MIKEYYYKALGVFTRPHDFAEKRDSARWGVYYHGGIDWWSKAGKSQYIYNLLAGIIEDYGTGRDYGNYVLIKHNPSFAGGPEAELYSLYCHLSEIDEDVIRIYKNSSQRFIDSGQILGKMGNTGNCWTKGITGYRPVTEKEVKNPKSIRGVHLHQQFHEKAGKGEKTLLLKDMIDKKIIKENEMYHYLYQWRKVCINPDKIMKYFMLLQGRKVS